MKPQMYYKILLVFLSLFIFSYSYSQDVYVKEGETGGGTSWADATGNLKQAMDNASPGDVIWVAAGTYKPGTPRTNSFVLRPGVKIYGGFPASGAPTMIDRAPEANPTILSGDIDGNWTVDAPNSRHVVYSNSATVTSTTVLDGFSIKFGYADGSQYGAGIYLYRASPIIQNCVIEINTSVRNGGGVYLRSSTAQFIDCKINENSGVNGAGVFMYEASPIFNNTIIRENTASASGGGINIDRATSLPRFDDCKIISNTAERGGGIYANRASPQIYTTEIDSNKCSGIRGGGGVYLYSSPSPTFKECDIRYNTATNNSGSGGAMHVTGSTSNPIISKCNFIGNTSKRRGGAIFSDATWTTPALDNNYFFKDSCIGNINYSGSGGAIYFTDNTTPEITNNRFIQNHATITTNNSTAGLGGAVCVYRVNNKIEISNNTFQKNTATSSGTGNSCGRGGAIFVYRSSANIQSNTFTADTANFGGAIEIYSSPNFTLSECEFNANIAISYRNYSGFGGAIMLREGGSGNSLISNCKFYDGKAIQNSGNSNSGRGGAIFSYGNNQTKIYKCDIHDNIARHGSALGYYGSSNACTITNSLIYDNTADVYGAAAYFSASNPKNFNNVYVNNTNGAIYCNNSDPTIENNIFKGNGSNTIYLGDGGSDPNIQYCNLDAGITAPAGAGGGGNYSGTWANNVNGDPLFKTAPPSYEITPELSPCISKGNPATTAAAFPVNQDYYGNTRIVGVVDIGVHETVNKPMFVQPTTLNIAGTDTTITMSEDNDPTAFALTLNAIDLDLEGLTWSVQQPAANGVAGVTNATTTAPTDVSTPQTNVIKYTPNANYNGTDQFKIKISDGVYSDVITVIVTINPVNDPPFFVSSPSSNSVKPTQTWTYNIVTGDPDDLPAALNLSATTTLPTGMTSSFTNGTGTLSWTPTDAQVSTSPYTITLKVADVAGESATQLIEIYVVNRLIVVPGSYATIQEAIDNAVDGEDKVSVVTAGTYTPFDTRGKTIEIEGNTTNPGDVIIDAQGAGPCIVVNGGSPTISGFTCQNGTGQTGLSSTSTLHAPPSGKYGGAILCINTKATFDKIVVENNTLEVNNNNGGSGGGIYIGNNSEVTISNATIQNNNSKVYRGGGICIDDSEVTIEQTTINNNKAGNYGGGIALYNSTLTIGTGVNVNNNSVDGKNGVGGGVYDHNSDINGSSIHYSGNSASESGNNIKIFN